MLEAIRLLYGYGYWANRRILEAARWVTTEQLVSPLGANG
jgi:hypothetical protein